MQHYNIPIFIPHLACPFKCIFCDQRIISAQEKPPTPDAVAKIIAAHLRTINESGIIEVAFFGGSFTALPLTMQTQYLQVAHGFVQTGAVQGIRLSTRPDYINKEILDNLKRWSVVTVELGVQSFSDEVLSASQRGYTAAQAEQACHLIKQHGLKLGIQLMTGLPADNKQHSEQSTLKTIQLAPEAVRIYPTVVIKGTRLAEMLERGDYKPQTLTEAVALCKAMWQRLEYHNITVIRMGLQSECKLNSREYVLAGAFHPAFRELVEQAAFFEQASHLLNAFGHVGTEINLYVHPRDVSKFTGHRRVVINKLNHIFTTDIHVIQAAQLKKGTIGVSCNSSKLPDMQLTKTEFLQQKFQIEKTHSLG